ncbi:hypothetical protein FRACYDRAFT_239266 [Fragilariopsis cylindrus CCMP1102]|uniref:RecQ-mediated genome instability protein 1 n=1 Tax=Fragilariopsis cylindrus CCMP1102 TaxID=635003 RepID=A0A1E7FES2_9STRA|nr:hypothetical protein FRACYDRAFT_239266 [Fragilariopsis cylindrus CCMP1102]|eukprot:OEU16671.1 hypothetical protein FRACYDRAFT_239266 [Fragilariopsis cylindrus CCMP1102]
MTDNTSTAANNIRNRLVLSLALQPTLEWLEECIVYLKSKNKTVNVDTILFQVLYSDLRDVVREKTLSSSSNSSNNNIFPPARQLREGIKYSSQANHDHIYTLPNSFALLCQLEELSDVSMTTQKRLEGSDHNNNNNNNYNYNQRPSRCLKVCMSHGYDCRDSHSNNDNNLNIVVGIETTMIPNLSVDALAGVKILLKGPILIRDSILLLNPKNCIAIGGCIEDLVRQQRDALKKAKRSAGVGVDATIRALIGTTGLEDEDDDNDEAHAEASGDVVVPRQRQQQQLPLTDRGVLPPAQLPSSRHQQQQVQPSSSSSSTTRNGPTINPYMRGRGTTTSLLSSSSNNTTGGGGGGGSTNSSRKIINAPVANPYNRSQHQQQRQETKVPAATARTTTTITAHNSVATNTINNPYNRGQTSITETSTSRQQQQQQHNNRTTTTTSHTARARVTPSPVPPFQNVTNTTNDDMTPQSHAVSSTTTTNNTSNTLIQNMPFATLYQLLLQLVDDREMYESQRNMIFRIKTTALANQGSLYFNVVKSKKNGNKSKKKEKKYEFFLSASFKSADTTDGTGNNDALLLSCRIHPSLLDPHFSLPPHELRALSRTNTDESDRITTEGGQKVQKAYFSPRFWRATLNLTTDEFFGEGSSISSKTVTERLKNLETPILLLIPDHQ